jgi:hypothetical protein
MQGISAARTCCSTRSGAWDHQVMANAGIVEVKYILKQFVNVKGD